MGFKKIVDFDFKSSVKKKELTAVCLQVLLQELFKFHHQKYDRNFA